MTYDWGSALFVQINDFYHIDYLLNPTDSRSMVLPRLATILVRLRKLAAIGLVDRVVFCLPGDFLNPSCLSRYYRGRQMVDILNRMDLDYVTFGNHEFDFEPDGFMPRHLLKRLEQSHFTWITSNFEFSRSPDARKFAAHSNVTREAVTIPLTSSQTVVMFGLLYKEDRDFQPFGWTTAPVPRCQSLIHHYSEEISDARHPIFVALTHQLADDDEKLADACPELRLIMGGHDHDVLYKHPQNRCLIVKTLSNARSIRLNWIVVISQTRFNEVTERLARLLKRLVPDGEDGTNSQIKLLAASEFILPALWMALTGKEKGDESDPRYDQVRSYAEGRGFVEGPGIFRQRVGDDYVLVFSTALDAMLPDFWDLVPGDEQLSRRINKWVEEYPGGTDCVAMAPIDLEVADDVARARSTNFGNFVADVVRGAERKRDPGRLQADVGLVNGGSFRLGRNVLKGECITGRTLCDILFHPNDVRLFELPGRALQGIVETSLQLRGHGRGEGHGDFLQISGLVVDTLAGSVPVITVGDGQPLQPDESYRVATTGYVAAKCQAYRDAFQSRQQRGVLEGSIRNAVEQELRANPQFTPDPTARWIFPPGGKNA